MLSKVENNHNLIVNKCSVALSEYATQSSQINSSI